MNFLKKLFQKKPKLPYELFGEKALKNLVRNFYNTMENDPLAKDCLAAHPLVDGKVPEETKTKLFEFLSGWMGGPNLFVQKHGAPRMRMRHMPFKIGEAERDQWLYCMDKALDMHRPKLRKKTKQMMRSSFAALAYRIQNH